MPNYIGKYIIKEPETKLQELYHNYYKKNKTRLKDKIKLKKYLNNIPIKDIDEPFKNGLILNLND